jgi:hypothetical protein
MATKRHKPEEIVSKLRQVDVLAAQAELATDRATLKATEERFERIVGMPPGELSIPDVPKAKKVTDENARGLISNNPSIKRQRLLVSSAEEDVDLVVGELLPRFSISSSVTRSKNANRNESATVGRTGTLAMTLTVPLYQKGAVYSRLRASKYTLGRQKLTLNETYRTSMENLMGNDERLATDNVEHSVKSEELIRDRFSHLKIIARARDRQYAFRLLNAGVDEVVRETFHSGVEAGRLTLQHLGLEAKDARYVVEVFKEHDERRLMSQASSDKGEAEMQAETQKWAKELEEIFAADEETNKKSGDD